MEPKFGELTLDELKKAYEACVSDFMNCDEKCPLYGSRRERLCVKVMQNSVLELIDSYNTIQELYEHYFKKAKELQDKDKENKDKITTLNLEKIVLEDKADKADKYDSVRNELIRTQELLKDAQDECRKRADRIKNLRDTIDTMDDDYNELNAKLNNSEMVRKSLEVDIKNITDQLDSKQTVINQLLKEKNEANEALLHYRTLMNSLHFIGEAMRGDQSGNHEKD